MAESLKTSSTRRVIASASAALLIAGFVVASSAPDAEASSGSPEFALGTTSLATPASGSRSIYVATNGTDFDSEYQEWAGGDRYYDRHTCLTDPSRDSWPSSQTVCTEPTIDAPLHTIQKAMRVARPGDVIVVRGGTYAEALGWQIADGTSSQPITLQAHPGETVNVAGQLDMKGADYWKIRGLRFLTHPTFHTNQAIVTIAGGTGWVFENNTVTGSSGVANMLVRNLENGSASSSAQNAGAPKSFLIRGNCITDNKGTGTHGQYHNIYMLSSKYSTGGVIEGNLLAGAPRGANIKVAASSAAQGWESPANLTIRHNTLVDAASGITVGLQSRDIDMSYNLIARPLNELQYDGAIKTYQMSYPGSIGFKDSYVSAYNQVVEYDGGNPPPIFTARIETGAATFSGSPSQCTLKPTSWPATNYGHITVPEGEVFLDVPAGRSFEREILWLASEGVTNGYSDGTFRPLGTVNRDAMAAFLYRFANSPSFTPPNRSPFRDITPSTPFYKEITWLASTGITGGYNDGTFRPGQPVNRDAMAAFLYRFAGEPRFSSPNGSPFGDMTPSTPFFKEITWLASTEITGGYNDGTFRPGQPVNRDAMAAFLFRFDDKGLLAN